MATLILLLGLGSLIAVVFYYVRKSGKDAQKVSSLDAELKDIGKANEIENKNAALSDGDAMRKLLSKWRR